LSLYLTKHHAIKVYWEWRYSSMHSLTSSLDGGEWSASRPGRLTPRERAPGTHLIGGWAGPRAVLDAVVKRKIPSPRWKSNPRTPLVQPVTQHYTSYKGAENKSTPWPLVTVFKTLPSSREWWFSQRWRFQVEVFSVVMTCNVVVGYQRFGEPRCLQLHTEVTVTLLYNYCIPLCLYFSPPSSAEVKECVEL
jgi:hypothetical protein